MKAFPRDLLALYQIPNAVMKTLIGKPLIALFHYLRYYYKAILEQIKMSQGTMLYNLKMQKHAPLASA